MDVIARATRGEVIMIKTNNLDEYVMLKVLKNYCTANIDMNHGCGSCPIAKLCDCALGYKAFKELDIQYSEDATSYESEPDCKEEK